MITRNVTEFKCDLCDKATSTTDYVNNFSPDIPDGMIALLSGVEIKIGKTKKAIVWEDKIFCGERCFIAFLINALSIAVAESKDAASRPKLVDAGDESTEVA